MKKAILVVGAYGCGNKGDDAILEGFQNTLGRKFKIISTCGKYAGIESILGENMEVLSCRMNEGMSKDVLLNLLKFFPGFWKKMKRVDAVIIGGGSLLHDITKYNLPFFFLLQMLAKLQKKKVIYAGVGAGPIRTLKGRRITKKYLNKCDGIFIRDPADYNLLKEVGVEKVKLSADMAFTVETDMQCANTLLEKLKLERKEYIVVTSCEWFKSDNFWKKDMLDFSDEKEKMANTILQLIQKEKKRVVFLPTVYHDYKLGEELEEKIASEQFIVLNHEYDCKMMASIVANSYMLFGMRMHSMIFAIRSGVPFVSTIYDKKVEHLLERVNMLEYSIEFDKIGTEEFWEMWDQIKKNYDKVSANLIKQTKMLSDIVWADMKSIEKGI